MFTMLVKGFVIGIANIIPGVSGGTMALMLGIYERLLAGLGRVNIAAVVDLLKTVPQGPKALASKLRTYDFMFMIMIGVGAIMAIVATSKLITYLINFWHDPTFAFFIGLVLFSIVVPYRMLKSKAELSGVICFVVACGMTLALSTMISGEQKLENAKRKHQLKVERIEASANAAESVERSVNHSAGHLIFLTVAGAVAISAMILPGISGAFILLLLGVYFEVLEAISARDFVVIGCVAFGCLFGLLLFTRLLNMVLARFHDQTVWGLIGLMFGSLYGLWPFQDFEFVGGRRIDMGPVVPEVGLNIGLALVAFVAAAGIIFLFLKLDKKTTV